MVVIEYPNFFDNPTWTREISVKPEHVARIIDDGKFRTITFLPHTGINPIKVSNTLVELDGLTNST